MDTLRRCQIRFLRSINNLKSHCRRELGHVDAPPFRLDYSSLEAAHHRPTPPALDHDRARYKDEPSHRDEAPLRNSRDRYPYTATTI